MSAQFSGDWYLVRVSQDGTAVDLESHATRTAALWARLKSEEHEEKRFDRGATGERYSYRVEHRPTKQRGGP